MSGELRECCCFDGPMSDENPGNVAIRCPEHRGEKAWREGAVYFDLNPRTGAVNIRTGGKTRPKMATSIKTGRRRGRARR